MLRVRYPSCVSHPAMGNVTETTAEYKWYCYYVLGSGARVTASTVRKRASLADRSPMAVRRRSLSAPFGQYELFVTYQCRVFERAGL